jgi:hypothetical protein
MALLWVKSFMADAVLGATLVAEPDIVTLSDELECGSDISKVHDPAVGGIHDSVLQENGSFEAIEVILPGVIGDPEYVQDISVLCFNWMCLEAESVLLDNLLECVEIVWGCSFTIDFDSWDQHVFLSHELV